MYRHRAPHSPSPPFSQMVLFSVSVSQSHRIEAENTVLQVQFYNSTLKLGTIIPTDFTLITNGKKEKIIHGCMLLFFLLMVLVSSPHVVCHC